MNYGIQNEMDIITLLNNKRFGSLPDFWKQLLNNAFSETRNQELIRCYKGKATEKADLYVIMNNTMRSFSVKMGKNVSVHSEKLSTFCGFLRWLKIDEENIQTLKLFHYGDGTTDGTGDKKYTSAELVEMYGPRIQKLNEQLNKDEVLLRFINRFLRVGTLLQRSFVYYIYYGTVKCGLYAPLTEFIPFLSKQHYDNIKTIHFGPFVYEPAYRGLDSQTFDNPRRYYVDIKWKTGLKDLADFNKYKAEMMKKINEK